MAGKGSEHSTESLRTELIALLRSFPASCGVDGEELRERVRRLIPAHRLLADLGKSLAPLNKAGNVYERLLLYFRRYPRRILDHRELMIVAGISEFARRIRELRTERGWMIATGLTIRQMMESYDLTEDDFEFAVGDVRPNDYVLLNEHQDLEAAHRYHCAKSIRNERGMSARDRLLAYFKANVGKAVSGEELRYVAKESTEWARRVRELRTEYGWPILTRHTGDDDLPIGVYRLESLQQLPVHDRHIKDADRIRVLDRDGHACRKCGWSHARKSPSDPRHHLELHHIVHHIDGGENLPENLITLCNICHDREHTES